MATFKVFVTSQSISDGGASWTPTGKYKATFLAYDVTAGMTTASGTATVNVSLSSSEGSLKSATESLIYSTYLGGSGTADFVWLP